MLLMPFQILGAFLRAILCVALLAGGVYLLKHWYDNREIVIDRPAALVVREQDTADFNAAPKPADQRRVVGQTADGRAIAQAAGNAGGTVGGALDRKSRGGME